MYYATIDTNVIVSALLNRDSVPGRVVEEALDGSIIPIYNNEILEEYGDVLRRPKFKLGRDVVELIIKTMVDRGIAVDAGQVDDLIPDLKDVVFYAVTMEARKSNRAYLVTGNQKHFPNRTFVVTPREMLEIIEAPPEAEDAE